MTAGQHNAAVLRAMGAALRGLTMVALTYMAADGCQCDRPTKNTFGMVATYEARLLRLHEPAHLGRLFFIFRL
eukprot:COSAG05_NODE_320_length_11481_cov_32.028730_4_plen_73_part_00